MLLPSLKFLCLVRPGPDSLRAICVHHVFLLLLSGARALQRDDGDDAHDGLTRHPATLVDNNDDSASSSSVAVQLDSLGAQRPDTPR